MDKTEIRQTLRRRRRQINPDDRRRTTQTLGTKLIRLRHLLSKNKVYNIAIYAAMGSELALTPALDFYKHNHRVRLYYPRYYSYTRHMHWLPLFCRRPKPCRSKNNKFNLMLLPVLAVDQSGYRLGQGRGYYDFLLKHRKNRRYPLTIGVGFDWQLWEKLPHSPYDVRLNAFLSAEKFTAFSPLPGRLKKWL